MAKVTVIQTSSKTSNIVNPIFIDETIDETKTTRRLLLATIVDNPKDPEAYISATIIHKRKGRNEEWEDVEAINLNTLKSGEGVKLHFSCTQFKQLREAIEKAYACGKGGVRKTGQYILTKPEEVIIPKGKEAQFIQALLKNDYAEDIWKQLVDNNPDLATKLSFARIHSDRLKALEEFETSIQSENKEQYWQQFLSKNDWIFGYGLSYNITSAITEQVYVGGKNLNNTNGHICDYLATSNGNAKYTVLVEIKTPNARLLGQEDRNGVFPISQDLAKAVSQIQVYCESFGRNSDCTHQAEQDYGTMTVMPKGIIVIGNSADLQSRDQRRAFELFRRGITSVEIITYDELLERAKFILRR